MKTVELFRLDMFGLDAYLIQPEENKKSHYYKQKVFRVCRIFLQRLLRVDNGAEKGEVAWMPSVLS